MVRVWLIRGVVWTSCRWGRLGRRDGVCDMFDGVRIARRYGRRRRRLLCMSGEME